MSHYLFEQQILTAEEADQEIQEFLQNLSFEQIIENIIFNRILPNEMLNTRWMMAFLYVYCCLNILILFWVWVFRVQ